MAVYWLPIFLDRVKTKDMNEQEIWMDVVGFEGRYRVSNMGRILNVVRNRTLKAAYDADGYLQVSLYNGVKGITTKVHRIVLIAFKGIDNSNPVVNHMNSIRNDNRLCNLEWTTVKENNRYAFKVGNRGGGEKHPMFGRRGPLHPLYGKPNSTGRIVLDRETGIFYDSALRCAECFNMNPKKLYWQLYNENIGRKKRFIYA